MSVFSIKALAVLLQTLMVMTPLTFVSPVHGQQRRVTPPASPPVAEKPAEPPPPTYEPELLQLAEILGALSYLSQLCTQPGSESWQLRMAQLLEAEGSTDLRKQRLAGAYNRGYLGYQPAHRLCRERSRLSIDTLVVQGQRITRNLARRYGG